MYWCYRPWLCGPVCVRLWSVQEPASSRKLKKYTNHIQTNIKSYDSKWHSWRGGFFSCLFVWFFRLPFSVKNCCFRENFATVFASWHLQLLTITMHISHITQRATCNHSLLYFSANHFHWTLFGTSVKKLRMTTGTMTRIKMTAITATTTITTLMTSDQSDTQCNNIMCCPWRKKKFLWAWQHFILQGGLLIHRENEGAVRKCELSPLHAVHMQSSPYDGWRSSFLGGSVSATVTTVPTATAAAVIKPRIAGPGPSAFFALSCKRSRRSSLIRLPILLLFKEQINGAK